MYVSNRIDFGHLMNAEKWDPTNLSPELWALFDNRWDWEKRYLHENYSTSLNDSVKIPQVSKQGFLILRYTYISLKNFNNVRFSMKYYSKYLGYMRCIRIRALHF